MANTTLVYSSVSDVDAMPAAVDTIGRSTVRYSRKQTPVSSKPQTNVSGLECYRKPFETERIQAIQPNIFPIQKDRVLLQFTNRPGIT